MTHEFCTVNDLLFSHYMELHDKKKRNVPYNNDKLIETEERIKDAIHSSVAKFWASFIVEKLGLNEEEAQAIMVDIITCQDDCEHTPELAVEIQRDAALFNDCRRTFFRLIILALEDYTQEIYEYLQMIKDEKGNR